MFAFEVSLGRGCRLEVGATRTPNRLQACCNVYPTIELFCFKQTVVRSVKVFSFDVDTCEGQTLAGGLFRLLVNPADLTEPFSQFDGTAVHFQGGPKAFNRLLGRLILHKELRIEQSRFDLAEVLRL